MDSHVQSICGFEKIFLQKSSAEHSLQFIAIDISLN